MEKLEEVAGEEQPVQGKNLHRAASLPPGRTNYQSRLATSKWMAWAYLG